MANRCSIDARISISIPDDWEVWVTSGDDPLFVAAAPDIGRDDIQPHIMISKETSSDFASSMEYMLGNLIYLRTHQDGYSEHEISELNLKGKKVNCVYYEAPSLDWVFANKQYFLVADGSCYLITCKMLPEQANAWIDRFDEIILSLEFLDIE